MKTYEKIAAEIRALVPVLHQGLYKGQSGKIGIIGGCFEYTGAPYYAGISSLKVGADLCHIICTEDAAVPIKSYSPELIVHPLLPSTSRVQTTSNARAIGLLSRLDALVVGPGLGRDASVLKAVADLINVAKQRGLPMVLDGDALFLVSQNPQLIQGYQRAILTPNAMEYARICHSMGIIASPSIEDAKLVCASELSRQMGNIPILKKGLVDDISDGTQLLQNEAVGSPRRCGGQGDVLAGSIGTLLAWFVQTSTSVPTDVNPFLLAAYGGSVLTRESAMQAFAKHKRSTTTPDIILELSQTFNAHLERQD